MTTYTNSWKEPLTLTTVGHATAQDHERIVDNLCDVYMVARKVADADDPCSEQTHLRAKGVVEHLSRIIDELQAWEKVNL